MDSDIFTGIIIRNRDFSSGETLENGSVLHNGFSRKSGRMPGKSGVRKKRNRGCFLQIYVKSDVNEYDVFRGFKLGIKKVESDLSLVSLSLFP